MINAGDDWRREIEAALAYAKVAVLLVSANFLASDFVIMEELPTLLRAAEDDGATVLPLIVSPCRFSQTEQLARFQAINPPEKPLSRLRKWQQDEFLTKTAAAVERALGSKTRRARAPTLVEKPDSSKVPRRRVQTAQRTKHEPRPKIVSPSPDALAPAHVTVGDWSAAHAYYQLGADAFDKERLEDAETHYRKALEISLACNDLDAASLTYLRLAEIAHRSGRFVDSERYYTRARDLHDMAAGS